MPKATTHPRSAATGRFIGRESELEEERTPIATPPVPLQSLDTKSSFNQLVSAIASYQPSLHPDVHLSPLPISFFSPRYAKAHLRDNYHDCIGQGLATRLSNVVGGPNNEDQFEAALSLYEVYSRAVATFVKTRKPLGIFVCSAPEGTWVCGPMRNGKTRHPAMHAYAIVIQRHGLGTAHQHTTMYIFEPFAARPASVLVRPTRMADFQSIQTIPRKIAGKSPASDYDRRVALLTPRAVWVAKVPSRENDGSSLQHTLSWLADFAPSPYSFIDHNTEAWFWKVGTSLA
ncbi:hypothetical protein HMN09_00941100 [Mycena chlorophos]|uniref:Uncharacterized protein n=1 Tax=Mycena chlorophos TaxID=658473 RepID=A0A8H6SKK5_MYCCL|nr:hypothetical protein HMN09_00941100 [Mycena chlorophos]